MFFVAYLAGVLILMLCVLKCGFWLEYLGNGGRYFGLVAVSVGRWFLEVKKLC